MQYTAELKCVSLSVNPIWILYRKLGDSVSSLVEWLSPGDQGRPDIRKSESTSGTQLDTDKKSSAKSMLTQQPCMKRKSPSTR